MASELQLDSVSGYNVYALIRNDVSKIYNGTEYVTYATADYANYDVAMTEQGSTGTFVGNFPSTSAGGEYTVTYKRRIGGSPAEGDTTLATATYVWNDTSEEVTTTAPDGAEYCASGDVAARLSQWGLDLRVDDDPDTVDDCIENASSDIDLRLLPIYSAADIAASRWVHFACRALSVYYVCLRRNEPVPSSVQAEYDKTMLELEAIAVGQLTLPGAAKATSVIRVSNQTYDNTRFPAIRVSRPRSTPTNALPRRNVDELQDRIVR